MDQDNLPNDLERKQQEVNTIKTNSKNGKIPVYVWVRDCDNCESSSVTIINANYYALERARKQMHENAEGPCVMYTLSWSDYANFKPTFRDRNLEAYENQNGA